MPRIAVLRKIGVDTGGSNVQFGINAQTGRVVVIEMNPRVSRSSALASKATGFPIAKVAAKLAVGYTLDELKNEITGGLTPASFEPTIDYVVTKIPRFAFEKFPAADARLTTQMKSVGEVMAIGRTFQESLQKALRGLETGKVGLDPTGLDLTDEIDLATLRREMKEPGPERMFYLADAFRAGMSVEDVHALSFIDPWFLDQIEEIVDAEVDIAIAAWTGWTRRGCVRSSAWASPTCASPSWPAPTKSAVRALRQAFGVRPVYKRVDSCAAEFATTTAYLYSTYEDECEAQPTDRAQDHGARRRAEPDRPGHRVRLLLRARRAGAARRRLRNHHGQLQPGNRLDRLRHLRPPVLRAADAGRRAGDRRTGKARGRDRAVRRPDPAEAGAGAGSQRRADHRHSPDSIDLAEDRERFQQLVDQAGPAAAAKPHRAQCRAKRWCLRARSAIRWWCARATCWAAARWKWCTPMSTSRATSARR